MEEGPLGLNLALAGLGFSSFSSSCEKLTDQCEVCGLKKKKVTAIVGHLSLKKRAEKKTTNKLLEPATTQIDRLNQSSKNAARIYQFIEKINYVKNFFERISTSNNKKQPTNYSYQSTGKNKLKKLQ